MEVTPKRPRDLTPEEKKLVWKEISTKATAEDRPPEAVINDTFGGDEEEYLYKMGKFLGVIKK